MGVCPPIVVIPLKVAPRCQPAVVDSITGSIAVRDGALTAG